MAWRSTQRTDPSQPPDYRTYSPEVTSSRSNLPVHRIAAADILFPRGLPYNIRKPSRCQENFLKFFYFFESFFKGNSYSAEKTRNVCKTASTKSFFCLFFPFDAKIATCSNSVPEKKEGRCPPFLILFSKRRPSKYRWHTSCRTRGRCPLRRSAAEACSGRIRRPSPSWSARTPARRTTWSAGTRSSCR